MSTPRVKRPFAGAASDPSQRQITSFFGTRQIGDSLPVTEEGPLRGPQLPSNVQSNLLSVGMRIRKSVPEGYKTNSTSAFKLWTDETPAKSFRQAAPPGTPSKELLPFCGINKVGGLDTQVDVRHVADDLPSLDDVPGLTFSQESNDTVLSEGAAYSNARKRGLLEDDEDEADPVLPWIAADDSVSPRSLAPAGWPNTRPMAMPRSRSGKKAAAAAIVGQENASGNDFDEAEFLVGDMDTSS